MLVNKQFSMHTKFLMEDNGIAFVPFNNKGIITYTFWKADSKKERVQSPQLYFLFFDLVDA